MQFVVAKIGPCHRSRGPVLKRSNVWQCQKVSKQDPREGVAGSGHTNGLPVCPNGFNMFEQLGWNVMSQSQDDQIQECHTTGTHTVCISVSSPCDLIYNVVLMHWWYGMEEKGQSWGKHWDSYQKGQEIDRNCLCIWIFKILTWWNFTHLTFCPVQNHHLVT